MADEEEEKNEGFYVIERTGVYKGHLIEDMEVTVKRTGQQVANVIIDELWQQDQPHPLTWIGGYQNIPNLLEGDEVYVTFAQNNYLYPCLYKYDKVPDLIIDLPEMPSDGAIVTFPELDSDERILSSQSLGSNGFIMETENFLFIKMGDEQTIYNKGNGIWNQATSNYSIKASSSELQMADKIKFGQSDTLGTMVSNLLQQLIKLCQQLEVMTTIGGPTTQTINPTTSTQISLIDQQLNTLKQQWEAVFE